MTNSRGIRVTAIMAARNASATILPAIESVLNQTHANFELLVVDDGSSDGTAEQAQRQFDDSQLRILQLPEPKGRAYARNWGLQQRTGELVAVCDADDISLATRFEAQAEHFRRHPELTVVGAQLLHFTENGTPTQKVHYPLDPQSIESRLLIKQKNPIAHAAAMFRGDWFDAQGGYTDECFRCQDLNLFIRGFQPGTYANLDEPLVLYRTDPFLTWGYYRENRVFGMYAVRHALAARDGGTAPTLDDHLAEYSRILPRLKMRLDYALQRIRRGLLPVIRIR